MKKSSSIFSVVLIACLSCAGIFGASEAHAAQGADKCLRLEREVDQCNTYHAKKVSSAQTQQCKVRNQSFTKQCVNSTICGLPAAKTCAAGMVCSEVFPEAKDFNSLAALKKAKGYFLYFGSCVVADNSDSLSSVNF